MKHYRSPNGAVYAFEQDGSQDDLIPEDFVLLTEHEVAVLMHPDPNTVPEVVTRRQALLALLAAGKLDQIELAIQNAPRAVQIAWEAAGTFERSNPLIEALAPQLGLTDADVDALFIQASKL